MDTLWTGAYGTKNMVGVEAPPPPHPPPLLLEGQYVDPLMVFLVRKSPQSIKTSILPDQR